MINMLIIDDEKEVGTFLTHLFKDKNYHVDIGYCGEDFEKLIENNIYDIALIDVKLPDSNGLQLLKQIKRKMPLCKTIIMTGYSTVKTAIEAIKNGADDYIEKPFDDIDELEKIVDHLVKPESDQQERDQELIDIANRSGILFSENGEMHKVLRLAYKIAPKHINVLINGETGTGKELLARFTHLASKRKEQPFIGINCGALPETLLESELFGHEKGAFTGATKERKGVFEIANRGTLFLDEIGDATLSTQVKLLRVVELGEYKRVGGEQFIKTNTRIISATNVDLFEAVEEKRFREDLLYRLNVVTLTIPPLRKRKEDIQLIAQQFLEQSGRKIEISQEVMDIFMNYDWPGNIRELSNIMKRSLSLLGTNHNVITTDLLPNRLLTKKQPIKLTTKEHIKKEFDETIQDFIDKLKQLWQSDDEVDLEEVLNEIKWLEKYVGREFILKELKETLGNRKQAAQRLNINERRLRYILNEKV